MTSDRIGPRLRRFALLALAVPAGVALAAAPAGAQTTGTPPQFASGIVTSIHGASVQVSNQTQNSESTVALTGSTTFEKRETVAATTITTGTCVRVNGTGSTAKGITATTVAVSTPTNGSCTGGSQGGGGTGLFGANGGRRFFGNGQRPDFGNGSRPPRSFGNGTRPANFAVAFGPVVSVSGDTLTVKATIVTPPAATKTSKTSKSKKRTGKTQVKPKTTTKNVKVTLTNSTTITEMIGASASDVTVGSCVSAVGTSAAGAVSANNVTISAPVNGTCTGGFGGFGFGRRGGGGGASA